MDEKYNTDEYTCAIHIKIIIGRVSLKASYSDASCQHWSQKL